MSPLNDPEFKRSQGVKTLQIEGKQYDRIPCGFERGDFAEFAIDTDCSNCGVLTGFLHLLPCDLEQCPKCLQQALSCSCSYGKRMDEIYGKKFV